ncbi:hypothetical protein EKN09_08910 [Vibrio penaeicida]|nr:hypothetical protein EKN09_08910 [Vibrio penaeicida]
MFSYLLNSPPSTAHNASLNRRQRTKQAVALRLKHLNHRKPKMPRVVCRLEAFVWIIFPEFG